MGHRRGRQHDYQKSWVGSDEAKPQGKGREFTHAVPTLCPGTLLISSTIHLKKTFAKHGLAQIRTLSTLPRFESKLTSCVTLTYYLQFCAAVFSLIK